ncbi:MAG TPA: TonB family protein [Rhizomicrobium sp.]
MLPWIAVMDGLDRCHTEADRMATTRGDSRGDAALGVGSRPGAGQCLLGSLMFVAALARSATAAEPPQAPGAILPASSAAPQSDPSAQSAPYPASCDRFLPPGVLHPQKETVTLLSYRLPLSGEMQDISVFQSSGSADLDHAALQCARLIRAEPLKVGGLATEVSWVIGYFWRVPPRPSGFAEPSPGGQANLCPAIPYPPMANRLRQEGTAVVSYVVATNGAVKDVAIAQSSGSPWLDGAAVTCAEFHHYYPATANGKPVAIDKALEIQWKLR